MENLQLIYDAFVNYANACTSLIIMITHCGNHLLENIPCTLVHLPTLISEKNMPPLRIILVKIKKNTNNTEQNINN